MRKMSKKLQNILIHVKICSKNCTDMRCNTNLMSKHAFKTFN